jgi:hypothetical protein
MRKLIKPYADWQRRVPSELARRVKSQAALTGRTLDDIEAEALEMWLTLHRKEEK